MSETPSAIQLQENTWSQADAAVHMVFQNKVNAKNAFDFNLDFI